MFRIVLRHSNYNNRMISVVFLFWGTPCRMKLADLTTSKRPKNKSYNAARHFELRTSGKRGGGVEPI